VYDGIDCTDSGDHDVWFTGYNSPVEGSVLSCLKEILGKLLDVTVVGEDGRATFGKVLCVSLQAGGAGDGLEALRLLNYPPKDVTLATMLEEEILSVEEKAKDWTMPEWVAHCEQLLANDSLSEAAKAKLTLTFADMFVNMQFGQLQWHL
jgi:hypothetical protein